MCVAHATLGFLCKEHRGDEDARGSVLQGRLLAQPIVHGTTAQPSSTTGRFGFASTWGLCSAVILKG